MSFRLSLPIFDGPFDLLLHLIRIDEVDITEISLAQVTDRYLEILQIMQDLDLDVAGDYLVVAATLMELKSRALLPQVDLPDVPDEDEFEGDPRQALIDRIIEYRQYREISHHLGDRAEAEHGVYYRTFREPVEAGTVDQFVEVNMYDLLKAFQRVLQYAATDTFAEVVDDEVHIDECVAYVREQLAVHKSLRLIELCGDPPTRKRIIGTFLALLEMIRMGEVLARPNADRTDLRVIWRPPEDRPPHAALAGAQFARRDPDTPPTAG